MNEITAIFSGTRVGVYCIRPANGHANGQMNGKMDGFPVRFYSGNKKSGGFDVRFYPWNEIIIIFWGTRVGAY